MTDISEQKDKLEQYSFQYITELVMPCNVTFADKIMAAWLDYKEGRTAKAQ